MKAVASVVWDAAQFAPVTLCCRFEGSFDMLRGRLSPVGAHSQALFKVNNFWRLLIGQFVVSYNIKNA